MKWQGAKEFSDALKHATPVVQQAAAREVFEVAKDLRDKALDNFTVYGIRMVTGRSRALLAVEPGPGLFQRGAKFKLEATAGYTVWPEYDTKSDGKPIPFYPHFLNYGTKNMGARPFWSAAVDVVSASFQSRMNRAVESALESYMRGAFRR